MLRNQVLEEEGTDGSEWAWAESDVDPAIEGSTAHRLAARLGVGVGVGVGFGALTLTLTLT